MEGAQLQRRWAIGWIRWEVREGTGVLGLAGRFASTCLAGIDARPGSRPSPASRASVAAERSVRDVAIIARWPWQDSRGITVGEAARRFWRSRPAMRAEAGRSLEAC